MATHERAKPDRLVTPTWWLVPLIGVGLGTALLGWSWGKWLHPVVDFGRELYVPWQILSGRVLQADLSYFNGPLSPWLNAIGFRIFGTGLRTLVGLNGIVLIVVTVLLSRLLARFSRPSTTLVGLVVFLTCFAFADPTGSGTYNHLAPYSHEMTHGFLLTLSALVLLVNWLDRPRYPLLLTIGIFTGLVFLTKSELFVAIAPVVLLGLLTGVNAQGEPGRPSLSKGIGILLGGMAMPVTVASILLGAQAGPGAALDGVLGSWRYAFASELHDLRFYRGGLGLLDPVASLGQIGLWIAIYGVVLWPSWWLARRTDPDRERRIVPLSASVLVTAVLAWLALTRLSVLDVARPLPLVLVLLGGMMTVRWVSRRSPPSTRNRNLDAALLVTTFSLLLLLKIVLRVRLSHYGFVLAAPATMISVWLLLEGIPRWIDQRGGSGLVFRLAGTTFLTVVTLLHFGLTARSYAGKTFPVGDGPDTFLADAAGSVVTDTLDRLDVLLGPDDTLAVLPEGVMLNYLARRSNPTPYYNFMPPELVMFGQEKIINAFEAHPPDWIVMTGRGATEYGFEYLGRGYGEHLADWVRENYALIERIGTPDPPDPRVMSWTMILQRGPG